MKILQFAVYFCVSFTFSQLPAKAAIFIHTLTFPSPLMVTDTASGNQTNGHITHSLEGLSGQIIRADLDITHEGNLDEAPTREIWQLGTSSGVSLGNLSRSQEDMVTDSIRLTDNALEDLRIAIPHFFNVFFTEMTSYNRESFRIYRSQLIVEHQLIPISPEMNSGFLLGILLIGVAARKFWKRG